MALMNVSPIGLQSLVGEELYLLNLHAVRLLVDAQKAFEIPFFFLPFVLSFLIHLKHYHQINLPKITFFLFLIARVKPGMISHPYDELLDSAC